MRYSMLHIPTLKEAPSEAEVASHRLMLRGGFIRKLSAGIYSFLPLGLRSLAKVKTIIREEMNRAGAQEVLLPSVQPADLWKESGRWTQYGPELLRFKDRKQSDFAVGPTHEEVMVDLVRHDVSSYRELPINLYQIATKFRDEIRPRAGLMRGREFIMKDAYSFDVDETHARESYDAMYEAYNRICRRMGFEFRVVDADSGNIGGSLSQEFQVLADSGEDSIFSCTQCPYTANVEKVAIVPPKGTPENPGVTESRRKTVETPGQRTIDEVTAFLGVGADKLVKTLLYVADGEPIAVMVRGDHELNEAKLKGLIGADELGMADDETVGKVTGAPVGFAGPVGIKKGVKLYADDALRSLTDFVVGANQADAHMVDVNIPADFVPTKFADLRMATMDDSCPRCGGSYKFYRGIEIGHIFYLGTKYSEPMRCMYLDEDGERKPMVMGCYGIGVTRILAAAIEQHHDDDGIKWPLPLAPFEVTILTLGKDIPEVDEEGKKLYDALVADGAEVLLDDRPIRPGVKFKDADLVGVPFQVVIGKKGLQKGIIELKRRATGERLEVPVADALQTIRDILQSERAKFAL